MNYTTKMLIAYLSCLVFLIWAAITTPIKPTYKVYNVHIDTIKTDTLIDVSGKRSLFIGDSHTVYDKGWQEQLCVKTRMEFKNTAVGGKRTDWMLTQLLKNIDSNYHYCFIWGGANDAASYTPIQEVIDNIQKMVNICNSYGVKPIVLTGFDPQVCIDVSKQDLSKWDFYKDKYTKLQNEIQTKIKNSTIIKNHFISRQDGDCGDFICHMSASGHRKMANGIINTLKLKTY
jgi:lysophospholipase L1-like esterase